MLSGSQIHILLLTTINLAQDALARQEPMVQPGEVYAYHQEVPIHTIPIHLADGTQGQMVLGLALQQTLLFPET